MFAVMDQLFVEVSSQLKQEVVLWALRTRLKEMHELVLDCIVLFAKK
jgi:hypothetical protein